MKPRRVQVVSLNGFQKKKSVRAKITETERKKSQKEKNHTNREIKT